MTPVQWWAFTFFRARLSGTLNRKRNLVYSHTVLGKLKHIDPLFKRTNIHFDLVNRESNIKGDVTRFHLSDLNFPHSVSEWFDFKRILLSATEHSRRCKLHPSW